MKNYCNVIYSRCHVILIYGEKLDFILVKQNKCAKFTTNHNTMETIEEKIKQTKFQRYNISQNNNCIFLDITI